MDLKNAVAVCLISLFSATLVTLIARTLDRQAESRLEPHLTQIVEELRAIRSQGGSATTSATGNSAAAPGALAEVLQVYYFHSNTRCPTCEAIELQAYSALKEHYANELATGEVAWKTVNYEEPDAIGLSEKFEVQMPVVVLARQQHGKVEDWRRLDRVWGLVDDPARFGEYIRIEIGEMLRPTSTEAGTAASSISSVPNRDENSVAPDSLEPPPIPVPE